MTVCLSFPNFSRRLPTPEGLSPGLSPSALNAHITTLIHSYTLRGINILVHCRGGVGRAGVIACCWILRLGLCGWFEPETTSSPLSSTGTLTPLVSSVSSSILSSSTSSFRFGPVRTDTLDLVERVISVVRRRRSVKAIETFEQVKCLIEYVEYLRAEAEKGL